MNIFNLDWTGWLDDYITKEPAVPRGVDECVICELQFYEDDTGYVIDGYVYCENCMKSEFERIF